MARPVNLSSESMFEGGQPTGKLCFLTLPEPTFVAISNEAAKRGMTLAQALAVAINDFCKKPL